MVPPADQEMQDPQSDSSYCCAAGLYNVYDGATRLFHAESKSRRQGLPGRDKAILQPLLTSYGLDPYFNKNLSLSSKYPLVDLI